MQGLFSAIWGTASLAGPALGAFLVNTLGWRSIFFVNLPTRRCGDGGADLEVSRPREAALDRSRSCPAS